MALTLSRRARSITPSPTLALTALAKQMRAEGKPVISFGAGEPDFDTPVHIKDAAKAALDAGDTKYTPAGGTAALREAVAQKFQRVNGLTYTPAQTFVGVGGKGVLTAVLAALVDPGDEVIIPRPYWVSFPEMVKLAAGEPVPVDTTEFRLTPDQLRAAVTPRTKLLILNSPNNPSGAMYSRDQFAALTAVCVEHDIAVISDETYEQVVYDGREHVSVAALPDMYERTITVGSCSKTYSMTGWRVGYCAGPEDIIKACHTYASQTTSNPTAFAQAGAVAALTAPDDALIDMLAAFDRRRRLIVELANEVFEAQDPLPDGAFYHFADMRALRGRTVDGTTIDTSDDLADLLLRDALVAVVPGTGFGMSSHVRFSYAVSDEDIVEGLARIKATLAKAQ